MSSEFEVAIATVLRRVIPDFSELISAQQLTAGASQETWRLCCRCGNSDKKFALRRAATDTTYGSAGGGASIATNESAVEAQLFSAAFQAGIPVPEVYYLLQTGDQLGAGYIMQWLEGETLGHKIVRSEEHATLRPTLAAECGRVLGQIHSINVHTTGLDQCLPLVSTKTLIDDTWQQYQKLNTPQPMIDYCRRWLLNNIPTSDRQCLVHGDFRNGNLMVNSTGINAVLDWELAHIGDPVRDLGWLCVNSWRFGKPELAVGGFGEIEDLLGAYRQQTGIEVSLEDLQFWQVFGSFWWSVCTLGMANDWREGLNPSLERPAIGRRSSEAQMDCVNLVMPGNYKVFSQPASNTLDTERGGKLPTTNELLESVVTFLKQDVVGKLDSRNNFLAKVAANSLSIAQREFRHGEEFLNWEIISLSRLLNIEGVEGNANKESSRVSLQWQLVDKLRHGMDLNTEGLCEYLRQTVAYQLQIDQPSYTALVPR